jgi:putative peptidoglycan lipid II flippase
MGEAYRNGMRLILLINIPAAAGLAVLSQPIIRVLFQHGAFRASDTQLMLPILAVSAVGLPFFSFVNLILRAFYAYKDMRTPVVAAVISFVLNVVLSLILMERLSTVGLALASNLAVVAQAIYLQWRLARRGPQFAIRHLWSDLIKILVAAAVMGLLVAGLWHLWQVNLPTSFSYDVLAIVLCIGAGVAAYAGLVWVLRVEGREEFALLARKLTTKFGKKSASPA